VSVTVRPLTSADVEGCLRVIASLPRFFGTADAAAHSVEDLRSNGGLVAVAPSGDVIGFVTWRRHVEGAAEISWMAVHSALRGRGVGTAMIRRLESLLIARQYRTLSLLTSASSHTYAPTRAFWEARGFTPILTLDNLWETDVALVYTKSLGGSSSARRITGKATVPRSSGLHGTGSR
jgi:ribosomal protein S18 acetylase RimI-like enzyme